MRGMLIGLGLAVLGTGAAAGPLDAYRGRARVLVVSAPDASDPHLTAQRSALSSATGATAERDVVVLEAIGPGAAARSLRAQLGLPAHAFGAVLVGKDGGAKLIAERPIALRTLLATIDAMPMRRAEMRSRR